jgi:hypothetical protein
MRSLFAERFPRKPQFLARPVIDPGFVASVAKVEPVSPIDILFVGTGHQANCEAVEWFLTAVWPLIAKQELRLRIVGGVVDLLRQSRSDLCERFRDSFTGRVSNLAPYYRAARSVIAPMRSGGGISLKTVEAFALGMPFVGTSKAYRGFPEDSLVRHGIRKHDDPHTFAQAVLKALCSGGDDGSRGRAVTTSCFPETPATLRAMRLCASRWTCMGVGCIRASGRRVESGWGARQMPPA